jgi:hypothetical protein
MALVLAALAGVGFLKYQKDQKSKTTVLAGASPVTAAAGVKLADEKAEEEEEEEETDEEDYEDDESEEEEEDDE